MTTRPTIRPDYDAYPAQGLRLDEKTSWLHALGRFTGPDLAIVGIVLVLLFVDSDPWSLTTCFGLALVALLGLTTSFRNTPVTHAPSTEQLEETTPEPRPQRGGAATAR